MATIKIEGAIWAIRYSWMDAHKLTWRDTIDADNKYMLEECSGVMICRHDIEVELDVIDVASYVKQQTAVALLEQKRKIVADSIEKLRKIDEQLGTAE